MQTTNFPDRPTQVQPPDSASPAVLLPEEKPPKTIRELAAEHTQLALNTYVDILQKGNRGRDDERPASDMSRIMAANALMDRAHGKPMQYVEQTIKAVTYQDLLSTIDDKEQRFIHVVEAQVKEIPTALTWDDVL